MCLLILLFVIYFLSLNQPGFFFFFFFNDTATTEIYTLSLHDALPICGSARSRAPAWTGSACTPARGDRKSTRLNSSHQLISYAVFCLKKKKRCRAEGGVAEKKTKITEQLAATSER